MYKQPLDGCFYLAARILFTDIVNNHEWRIGYSSRVTQTAASVLRSTAIQADGAWFAKTVNGEYRLIVSSNGIDVTSADFTLPPSVVADSVFTVGLYLQRNNLELWINSEYIKSLSFQNSASLSPFGNVSNSVRPMFVMANGTSAPVSAVRMVLREWELWDGGVNQLSTAEVAAKALQTLPYSQHSGIGFTSFTNSAAPATIALSNTVSPHNSPGQIFSFAAVAGGNTDYILNHYWNDNNNTNTINTGRSFLITGVDVEVWNAGAANSATVPTTLLFL